MTRRLAAVAALLSVIFSLHACSSSDTSSNENSDTTSGDTSGGDTGDSDDKYAQTWSTGYSQTTCKDWNARMSDKQQWVASADMLTGARNNGDEGEGLPSDALVDEFRAGITTACVEPTMSLTDVAVTLYLTERARFRP